ncbi:MAG: peptidylprolyl isomerase [Oligoflexia bacterium]|nr:peptidylprolyl isomerase [Oligoflexia bacterium]
MKLLSKRIILFSALLSATFASSPAIQSANAQEKAAKAPVVVITTNMGKIEVALDPKAAPISTENFLQYVKDKHYDGTVFHRVIKDFMIQGGGLNKSLDPKGGDRPPIKNEATNGLKNTTGTIAMARTSVVDSATDQFFINVKDNSFLDHRDDSPQGFGYAVFGHVTKGLDVVTKIENSPTEQRGPNEAVPVKTVEIKSIRLKK